MTSIVCDPSSGYAISLCRLRAISSAILFAWPSRATICCATDCSFACLSNASGISSYGNAIATTTSCDRRESPTWNVDSSASAISRAFDRAIACDASWICDHWRNARIANDSSCATWPISSANAACAPRVRTSATTWWSVCGFATCSCSWTFVAADGSYAAPAAVAARVAATATAAVYSFCALFRVSSQTRGSIRTSCSWIRCCSTRSRPIPTRCCPLSSLVDGRRPLVRSVEPPFVDFARRSIKFRTLLFDYLSFLFHQLTPGS